MTTGSDDYAGLRARFYAFYIERPLLARAVGRLLWASDFRPLYRSLQALDKVAPGTTVVDIACGAGLALRWLHPGVGYVGVDNSPSMLERARAAAQRCGFHDIDLREGDAEELPIADETADVCLLYNALHVFVDPQAAVDEAVRCLRIGGRLVGSMLVRGGSPRADRLLELDETMGPGGTATDLTRWLDRSGLGQLEVVTGGAMAVFGGRRSQ